MMRGFYAGLIAGIVGGFIFTIGRTLATISGFYFISPLARELDLLTFDMLMGHLGYAIGANGIFGGILGIIYSKFYDAIPGRGVKKGFVFGLIKFFIFNIFVSSSLILVGLLTGVEQYFVNAHGWFTGGIQIWLTYGIVLGLLYERLKL